MLFGTVLRHCYTLAGSQGNSAGTPGPQQRDHFALRNLKQAKSTPKGVAMLGRLSCSSKLPL
eukprot:9168629-Alexandrium_andersonii.AAC.1